MVLLATLPAGAAQAPISMTDNTVVASIPSVRLAITPRGALADNLVLMGVHYLMPDELLHRSVQRRYSCISLKASA